jgi:Immunity protein 49
MERVCVQRHAIDSEPYRRQAKKYNDDLVKYFEGDPPPDHLHLDWLGTAGRYALMFNSLFSPDGAELWTGARAIAQGRAGTFAAGTASGRVRVPFGDKMVEIDRNPDFNNASGTDWLDGWFCATVVRDTVCLEMLAEVPDEIFRISRVAGASSHDPWRHALCAYYRRQDPTAFVERALFMTEPAQLTRLLKADVAKVWASRFRMLLPLFHKDADAFNRVLVDALEVHKKFYGKKAQSNELGGYIALAPLALCALAHDAGLPIEVDSEYLPTIFIEGKRPR